MAPAVSCPATSHVISGEHLPATAHWPFLSLWIHGVHGCLNCNRLDLLAQCAQYWLYENKRGA